MCTRDAYSALARTAHSRPDRALARAPPEHQQLCLRIAVDRERRHLSGDARDLRGPHLGHAFVVGRVVGDVAGLRFLLESADSVLEAGRAGYRPGARLTLVAGIGQ